MRYSQHPILWRKYPYRFLQMVEERFIIVLKAILHSGTSRMGRLSLVSKVMRIKRDKILKPVSFFFFLIPIKGFHFFISFFLAWSVSLNPQGETYASTGISGNVFIHSAQPSNFGERLSTLPSGRHKFGMFCSHVCFFLLYIYITRLTFQIEPRWSTNCHVVRKWTDLHIRYRNKHFIHHFYLSCHVCTFDFMVSRLKCTFYYYLIHLYSTQKKMNSYYSVLLKINDSSCMTYDQLQEEW